METIEKGDSTQIRMLGILDDMERTAHEGVALAYDTNLKLN